MLISIKKSKRIYYKTCSLAVLIILTFTSCTKSDDSNKSQSMQDIKVQSQNIQAELDNFKPSIPIEKLAKLTVANFSIITISLLEQQIVFSRDLLKKGVTTVNESIESDSETAEFISYQNNFRNEFFGKWNITDNDYSQFGITNNQEIQEYFNTRTDLREKMTKLQLFLQQIQEGTDNESDEYNIKDADAIVSNTPSN